VRDSKIAKARGVLLPNDDLHKLELVLEAPHVMAVRYARRKKLERT